MIKLSKNKKTIPTKGWMRQLDAEEYHKLPHVNSHGLMDMLRSPAHWLASKKEQKDTASMRFGGLCHSAVLEPPDFFLRAKVLPSFTGTGSVKKKKDWIASQGPDAIILKNDEEFETIRQMSVAVHAHEKASYFLQGGYKELSGFWVDPTTNLPCRMRGDNVRNDGIVVDYKTTSDARFKPFQRNAFNMQYHLQAAHYLKGYAAITGLMPEGFVIIAQESKKPFLVNVFVFDPELIEMGSRLWSKAMGIWKKCADTGEYPGYGNDILNLTAPSWGIYEEEMEEVNE